MASSPSTFLLPGSSSLGSKSILMKQSPPTLFHAIHHQYQHPFHRPSISSHSHQQMMKSIPNNDTFHPLTVPNTNNGTSLLTNNNDDNGSVSNGHSLSQSMESINNIGLPDDEVR
jgi:hypothetical protein